MKKGFLLIIIFCLTVWGSLGVADLSEAKDQWSKQARQALKEFELSLKGSAEGRFQTVKVDNASIFIIDTKLGHLWVFRMSPDVLIKYAGQVYPGKGFWRTTHRRK